MGTTEEALVAELPAVLANPPWLDPPPPARLPTMEGIEQLPLEDRVSVPEADRARLASPKMTLADLRGWNKVPAHLEPRTPEMDRFVAEVLGRPTRYGASYLHLMSDAAAWAYLEKHGSGNLLADGYDVAHLFVRFGPRVLSIFARPGSGVTASDHLEISSAREAIVLADAIAKGPKSARERAEGYLAKFPEAAAVGIIPRALSKKTQKRMLRALQVIARDGREPIVRSVAAKYGREVEDAVEALLAYQPPPAKPPKLPDWYRPEDLPSIRLREGAKHLPSGAVVHLGTLLAMCTPAAPHERLAEVKAACSADSLARFAWALFERWLQEGADSKQDWALTALGWLGDDVVAGQLAQLVRTWPGEAAHARAVKGLDALANIGSDVALMHLDGIAEKLKFRALQDRAREKIEAIAEARGLSRDELADRIAPTLGLDHDGSRVLSFGVRSFRVGFDEHLVPAVFDDAGQRLADLPKPRATDDAAAAAVAVATWKTLKKEARAVAALQIQRLERAMCTVRRWTADEFRSLLVGHPLVFHLVRRLVWGIHRADGPPQWFRVAEDRSFADVDDVTLSLPAGGRVGLAHRLELSDADVRRWGSVLADYRILQPFAQLGREVFPPTAEEAAAESLDRAKGSTVATGRVLGLLSRGWRRGEAGDGGTITEMYKPLLGGLWAELSFEEGIYAGSVADSPEVQTLNRVVIRRGTHWSDEVVPLGRIGQVAFSEIVRDLESLRG